MTDPEIAEPLRGRCVALCVTGSIAAYKAVDVARMLVRAGAKVLPVMTASAARFVGPITLSGICGEAVATSMWDSSSGGEAHVRLAARADLVAIVPCTADLLSRLAQGRADDLVTALALSATGPVIVAPAMHPRMWEHPATQRNVTELAAQGRVALIGPVHGEVASGDEGMGRMAAPGDIVEALRDVIVRGRPKDANDLEGVRLVVTAGPTVEDIDPVRFLGNRSSGKMGFALAARARARGAEVTLVAGPVVLPTPPGVRRVDVRSALEMRGALWKALLPDLSGADVVIMAAAVADHRPAEVSSIKIKKSEAKPVIELVKTPDILAEIGGTRGAARRPVLVGFAVETGGVDSDLFAYGRRKLEEKRVDVVVCNDGSEAFGRDDNRIGLVTSAAARSDSSGDGENAQAREPTIEPLPKASKTALADIILDRVRALVARTSEDGGRVG